MKRDYRLYLEDMLEAMDKIERYTRGLTFEQFSGDDKTVDAVIRGFTILGEAAKNIPSTLRTKYPDVPWKDIAGMRDKLVPSISESDTRYCGRRLENVCLRYGLYSKQS
ncbi:MAG: hypothetical protein HW384_2300 [Dehalococcoidia bacterium]|nr:hypothetical protein [Dehalococcoidia bacterium]